MVTKFSDVYLCYIEVMTGQGVADGLSGRAHTAQLYCVLHHADDVNLPTFFTK